jgi:NTE family protein
MRALNRLGGEWRFGAQLGDSRGVSTEFYQPLDIGGRFFAAASAEVTNSTLLQRDGRQLIADFDISTTHAGFDAGTNFGRWGRFATGVHTTRGRARFKASAEPMSDYNFEEVFLRAEFRIDTLDNVHFPKEGISAGVTLDAARESWGSAGDYQDLGVGGAAVTSVGKTAFLFSGRYDASIQGTLPDFRHQSLGGFLNLSGLPRRGLVGDKSMYLSTILTRQFAGARDMMFGFPTYRGDDLFDYGWLLRA